MLPELEAFPVPSLSELLEKTSDPFPYLGSYEERKWEPVLVLHSSGSTGAPKPIVMNHATFAVADHDRLLPPVPGRKTQNYAMWDFPEGGSFYSPFPPFHLAGFTAMVALPIYAESTNIVLGPADRPPAPDLAISIMKTLPIKALFCPPSIAEGIARDTEALELAEKLKFLLYAGGPLSEAAGSVLSKVTDVCQFYGQTETGPTQSLVPHRENWAWLEWHPAQEVRMQAYADDMFEMVMDRNPALEKVRSLSCNFPNEEVWHTKDLFKKHPTKELWQFAGRADDIIVLSTGEKYNPVPAEVSLGSIPGIKGAMIVGHSRFSPALLLELTPNASGRAIADLWPEIDVVNGQTPEFGKIRRSLIFIASSDKAFERAGKGTIIRTSTERLFQSEIDYLYSNQSIETKDVPQLSGPVTIASLHKTVVDCVSCISNGKEVDEDADIFASGFDSLQVLELTNLIKHSLKLASPGDDMTWLSPVLIYHNPTQAKVTQILWDKLNRKEHSQNDENKAQKMKALVDREILLIDQMQRKPSNDMALPTNTVILTGATGSLGRHILRNLILDASIDKVYCLIRSTRSYDGLIDDLKSLPVTNKVRFLQYNLEDPKLGLSSDDYEFLSKTATTVIHAAWVLDFNRELMSFDNQFIASMKYLFQLLLGKSHAHFIFVSSLSTVGGWATIDPSKAVPEAFITDTTVVTPTGYAESKYVAEWLCQYASSTLNIRSSVLRVGQIAGSVEADSFKTAWNDREWIPIMLKTSKSLQKIPYDLPLVDWLPVDVVANIIHDIVRSQTSVQHECNNFNVVNPHTIEFGDLLPSIQPALKADLQEIDLQIWIQQLEKVDQGNLKNIEAFPAIKILNYFKSLLNVDPLSYEFHKLREMSASFREVRPIDGGSFARWIRDMAL